MEYDPNRITHPIIEGNLPNLRERIPHPCHLRYRDLTEFVYKRKAEKYEILSQFMGFANALNIQNDLQKCAGRLEQELEILQKDSDRLVDDFREVSEEEPKDIENFIKIINTIFDRQGIAPVKELTEVKASIEKLREQVEEDEKSQKLSLWKEIQGIINRFYPVGDIRLNISEFQKDLIAFKRDEEEISKLILLDLYEKGIEALESLKIYDKCPLCDQPYEGNLIEHIKTKQGHLDRLSKKRNELDTKRKTLLSSIDEIIQKIDSASSNLEEKKLEPPLVEFKENLITVKPLLKDCKGMLETKIEIIDKEFDFTTKVSTEGYKSLLASESEISEKIVRQVEILEKDESRRSLVDDFQRTNNLQNSFMNWARLNKKFETLEEIKDDFEKIRGDYVEETKRGVQASFDKISSDLTNYFKTLEKDCEVVANPKIKLFSEKDKAVELEIIFGGDPISPAYKILSESQLNSFGLSIFLASIKNFNTDFKFIILDDVINSFDAYKRPRVINLLEEHFSDYQILLLTHDSIWLDRLQRSFPQWIRKHFFGWDYAIGPRIEPGKNSYEQIDEFLTKDNPTEAGRTFGVYLEWILQLLCENCEALMKYNRRNEHSLSELFQSFRERLEKKLKTTHSIVKLISDFETDTGFRNFCAHWKDPEIPYTSSEIGEIVERWKNIETKIECDNCHKYIRYEKVDGYEHVFCPCTKLNLKLDKYYK